MNNKGHIFTAASITDSAGFIHEQNVDAGWWSNINTGEKVDRNVGELLMLCVSELAEAMEGHRKDLMDDHLTQYKMFDVELADCMIRILDICGSRSNNIGEIMEQKLRFNQTRLDHKRESRLMNDGKKY